MSKAKGHDAQVCGGCRFWIRTGNNGECRRFEPKMVQVRIGLGRWQFRDVYPVTEPEWRCYRWESVSWSGRRP